MPKTAEKSKPSRSPRLPAAVWVFLLFLAALSLATLIAPDRAFSAAENRVLKQFPAWSMQKLFDGDDGWTQAFETYYTDQFALRDGWVAVKASAERLIGKHENDGVYFAGDALMEKPQGYDEATRARNLKSISSFAAAVEAETYLALVPNACCVNADRLPQYADDGNQAEILARCAAELTVAQTIALLPTLSAHSDKQMYYRTDHHPTSLGAYAVYRTLAQSLGLTPYGPEAYEQEVASTDFSGTARAKSGAWWVKKDEIVLYRLKNGPASTLATYEGDASTQMPGLYDRARLSTADQYTVFLGGNHPRQVISTDGTADRRLLMVKDSFAHCIAPFLAPHYAEIHLLDLRYYRGSVQAYVRAHAIDQVLVLYSVGNFMTDRNLLFLNLA